MTANSRVVVLVILLYINVTFSEKSDLSQESEENVFPKDECKDKKCIFKCCPYNTFIDEEECVSLPQGLNLNFSDVDVYNNEFKKSGKSVKDDFQIVAGNYLNKTRDAYDDNTEIYLIEDSTLQHKVSIPNAQLRWYSFTNDVFCLDYNRVDDINETTITIKPVFRIIYDEEEENTTKYYVQAVALLVSCAFLLAVLVVYCMLPELRTLGGKVLMACIASLLGAYALLLIMLLLTLNSEYLDKVTCISLTCSIYFFFMASFLWMNVMSWDIWWSFRGFAKQRQIHRRGESFKYLIYSAYAWGLSLGMVVMFAVLDQVDVPAGIIKPNVGLFQCFIDGPEKMLYFYVPMLILIICNWVLFLMTAFNIWRISKCTEILNASAAGSSAAHRTQRLSFILYLKLSVVMGISFVLEVASNQLPGMTVWYITDMYNMLIGLIIFLLFVGKRKMLRKLYNKFHIHLSVIRQNNRIVNDTFDGCQENVSLGTRSALSGT